MAEPPTRLFGGDPSVDDRARGHVTIPKWIQALPDLHSTAKTILGGLIGSCFSTNRTSRVTIRKLAADTGLKPCTVKYSLSRLVDLGFILHTGGRRQLRRDMGDNPLFDPRGIEDTRRKNQPAPANGLADPSQPISRPPANGFTPCI